MSMSVASLRLALFIARSLKRSAWWKVQDVLSTNNKAINELFSESLAPIAGSLESSTWHI